MDNNLNYVHQSGIILLVANQVVSKLNPDT